MTRRSPAERGLFGSYRRTVLATVVPAATWCKSYSTRLISRGTFFAAAALAAAIMLSGCGGTGHQASDHSGKGLSDQEVSQQEKIVSGAETAADQAVADGG